MKQFISFSKFGFGGSLAAAGMGSILVLTIYIMRGVGYGDFDAAYLVLILFLYLIGAVT